MSEHSGPIDRLTRLSAVAEELLALARMVAAERGNWCRFWRDFGVLCKDAYCAPCAALRLVRRVEGKAVTESKKGKR